MTPWEAMGVMCWALSGQIPTLIAGGIPRSPGGCFGNGQACEWTATRVKVGSQGKWLFDLSWPEVRRLLLSRLPPEDTSAIVAAHSEAIRTEREYVRLHAAADPDDEAAHREYAQALTDSWDAFTFVNALVRDAYDRTLAPDPRADSYGTPSLFGDL